MQTWPLTAQQLDGGETDGVWPARRSRGKHTARIIVEGRFAHQFTLQRPVKLPEHEEMGKSLDIEKTRLEFRQDFEDPLCGMLGVRLSESRW